MFLFLEEMKKIKRNVFDFGSKGTGVICHYMLKNKFTRFYSFFWLRQMHFS